MSTKVPLSREPVAIVGIGCRFPGGCNDVRSFWQLMTEGRDGIVPIPTERWDQRRFYDPDPDKPGKIYVQRGGFLQQSIDGFDSEFFNISPREAPYLDPQQRLLLEVSWEALEDAGIVPGSLEGSDTGVFIGGFTLDQKLTQMSTINRELIRSHTAMGSTMTILSNRLSYFYDFRGPSVSMDTACSSSSVALHFACNAIWSGDCSVALAGGVNLIFRPEYMIAMCKGRFLAPDGYSKSFDARANGYARGEGAGILVLKPESAAHADGDLIYATICATGVNQDGRTEGITVPNASAQQTLIEKVCRQANVSPRAVSYFEAHGTGTSVGDPIESAAIGAAVGKGRSSSEACWVGSVKANIGHLEAAAGVAGVIKAALVLQHKQIPPVANLQNPNPNIPFLELGLRLPRKVEDLPVGNGPVYVAANSFGYGGTNAHILLREADRSEESPTASRNLSADSPIGNVYLLPLSARSMESLRGLSGRFADAIKSFDGEDLRRFCWSAGSRRTHHDYRTAVTGSSVAELTENLVALRDGESDAMVVHASAGNDRGPVFVFTGMGPQWWGMGRDLILHNALFRDTARQCDALFEKLSGWSIIEELLKPESASRITSTDIAQPANFVIQVSLARLWQEAGVNPSAVVGHSVGEIAAAFTAGVLSLEEAVAVSYHRSRIQKRAAGLGTMLAVGLSEEAAEVLLVPYRDSVSIAANNGPEAVTLAGANDALSAIAATLEARGVFNRFLQVEVAYHSHYMDPLLDEVRASLAFLCPAHPTVPLYSTVSGKRIEQHAYHAEYWCDNIRRPVRFKGAMDELLAAGFRTFIEVGPHPVLGNSIKECCQHRNVTGEIVASLRRDEPQLQSFISAVSRWYSLGHSVDWSRLYPGSTRYLRLPTYAWQRESYWTESAEALLDRRGDTQQHVFLEHPVSAPLPTWETAINPYTLPFLDDHRVDGLVVFPGAAYVEAGLALHERGLAGGGIALEDISFRNALLVDPGDEPVLRLDVDRSTGRFSISSRRRDDRTAWTEHAKGLLSERKLPVADRIDRDRIRTRCPEPMATDLLYDELARRGLLYGPHFRGIQEIYRGEAEVLARIVLVPTPEGGPQFLLPPPLLDACFQALIALLPRDAATTRQQPFLPVRIDQVRLLGPISSAVWCHGELTLLRKDSAVGNLFIMDEQGQLLAEVRGLVCKALTTGQSRWIEADNWLYRWHWQRSDNLPKPTVTGPWLIVGNDPERKAHLAEVMDRFGVQRCISAAHGTGFERIGDHVVLNLHDADAMQSLLQDLRETELAGIAYLADGRFSQLDDENAEWSILRDSEVLRVLLQEVSQIAWSRIPRVYVVTRDAQTVLATDKTTGLAQSTAVGLARVAFNEFADLRCTLVDLPADTIPTDFSELAVELLGDAEEDDVAWRNGERYCHVLVRTSAAELDREAWDRAKRPMTESAAFTVQGNVEGDGVILRLAETVCSEPGRGEALVQVDCVEVDREDLLSAFTFHNERRQRTVWGRIVSIGEEVDGLAIGTGVVGLSSQPVGNFIVLPVSALLPKNLSSDTAGSVVGLPLAHIEAYHGLVALAQLRATDVVLIHGTDAEKVHAAIEVVRSAGGVTLISSPDPRALERACGMPPESVLDSESLDSEERIKSAIKQGIDVVYGAGAAPPRYVTKGLLAHNSRVVIAGAPGHLNSGPFDFLVCVNGPTLLLHARQDFLRALEHVNRGLAQDEFSVPKFANLELPTLVEDSTTALAVVSAGKTRLELSTGALPLSNNWRNRPLFAKNGTCLITGGCNGFGLKVAEWAVAAGAKHLLLLSRNGAHTEHAENVISTLAARGANIRVGTVDVAEFDSLRQCLRVQLQDLPPIRWVFHSAAVLEDGPIATMTAGALARGVLPKAMGAWNLHRLLGDMDSFVMFSSVSSIIGNSRQGNYVAGNAFLDTLAHYRRGLGLPAISINWGALSGAGMTTTNDDVLKHLELMGMRAFDTDTALRLLETVVRLAPVQLGVMSVDWQRWAGYEPMGGKSHRFAALTARDAVMDHDSPSAVLRRTLTDLAPGDRQDVLTMIMIEVVAKALKLNKSRVDAAMPLSRLGVDSLLAVELQTAIEQNLGVALSTLEILRSDSLNALGTQCLKKMGLAGTETSSIPVPSTSAAVDPAAIDSMADEAVDKILNDLLNLEEA